MAHTDDTEDDYFIVEQSEQENRGDFEIGAEGDGFIGDIIKDETVDVCYSIKVVKVCVESLSPERIVLSISIAGVKVARATLTPANGCVKVKGKVAGDGAKVEAKICADFARRRLTIEGKICVLWLCTKFKQTILKW